MNARLENSMVVGAQAVYDALDEAAEANARLVEQEAARLKAEFIEACEVGPGAVVDTPAWGRRKTAPLEEVIGALTAGHNDYGAKLVELLAAASKSTDPGMRLPAQALIARMAAEHAEFHADDAATEKLA